MNNKNLVIEITSGTIFKALLIIGLFALLYLLSDLVLVLLTAVVIASAIEPITQWLLNYRIPRVIAVIAIYFALVVLLFGIFYFFIPPLLSDLSGVLVTVSNLADSISISNPFGVNFFGTGDIGQSFSTLPLQDTVSNVRDLFSGNIFQGISTIFGGLLSFILIIVFSFYFAVQERGIEDFLRIVTPLAHEKYAIGLWKRSQRKIGQWMQGQLLLGLIVGVLSYLGLAILGVKHALLLALLAAMFELIPLFGPVLAAIPAVIFGFLDSVTLGLMVLGLYVIIQQFENHLIYPLVVRKVVGVSPIVVIISLIIGAKIAGFLGILLAVPVAAALIEFTDDIQRRKLEQTQKRAAS